MKYIFFTVVITILALTNVEASDKLVKECYNLGEIMKQPLLNKEIVCKYGEGDNFCFYESPRKAIVGTMEYTSINHIPCTQFYKIKKIAEYNEVSPSYNN